MAGLPNRPPSVCALSPQELSYETAEVDKIHIPANALIVAENEVIFLAIANSLKDLKAVLIAGAGYVYFGKLNCRIVFLLKPRGPVAVIQSIKALKPKAGVFLGFCKTLQSRPNEKSRAYEIGDLIVAEEVLRKVCRHGKLESNACSEYLINVFEHGKFGWAPPKYRKQAVHVGKVLQVGLDLTKNEKASSAAIKTTSLDILECCRGLEKEWISIVGVIGTQRYHSDASWEQYVAVVLSSFVNKVLQNDQVFAILGGEGRVPRENTPSPCNPLQETVSLKGYQVTGSDLTQEQLQRQAEMYWAQLKDAFDQGYFHLPQRKIHSEISLQDEFRITTFSKTPVENSDEKIDRRSALGLYEQATKLVAPVRKPQSFNTESQPRLGGSRRIALPPLPSYKAENTEIKTASSVQRKMSGHAQSSCSTLTSSMAVTMQAALLPLGASIQNQGSCFEVIRIRAEERATVGRHDGILPPITRGQNKV